MKNFILTLFTIASLSAQAQQNVDELNQKVDHKIQERIEQVNQAVSKKELARKAEKQKERERMAQIRIKKQNQKAAAKKARQAKRKAQRTLRATARQLAPTLSCIRSLIQGRVGGELAPQLANEILQGILSEKSGFISDDAVIAQNLQNCEHYLSNVRRDSHYTNKQMAKLAYKLEFVRQPTLSRSILQDFASPDYSCTYDRVGVSASVIFGARAGFIKYKCYRSDGRLRVAYGPNVAVLTGFGVSSFHFQSTEESANSNTDVNTAITGVGFAHIGVFADTAQGTDLDSTSSETAQGVGLEVAAGAEAGLGIRVPTTSSAWALFIQEHKLYFGH